MLGNPKFNYDDRVSFSFGDETIVGTIEIIDRYGTFFDNSDVSYDILVDDYKGSPCLFKHINEHRVNKVE